ncbi:MAG TPA: hypothetical protein VFW83_10385 [Bryobacteraceae bacterium]|nr:hypothetical protein [Bryobacteraceae bacterium]
MPQTPNQEISRDAGPPVPLGVDAVNEDVAAASGSVLIEALTQLALRKRVVARFAAGAILAGAILCVILPVRYTATTEILPPRQTRSAADLFLGQIASTNLGSLAGIAGGELGLKNPDDLYIGLLRSRPVADAIIHRFDLKSVYRARDLTDARRKLADYTTIVSEKSDLISISVTDKDKQRSAEIANAYTEQLRALTQTLAVSEAAQRRLFYEQQLKNAKEDLVKAEVAFQNVQQKKGLVQPDAQARALIGSLAELRAEIAAKQVQVQALRSYSTERNPDVQLAENQLSSLQAQLSKLERSDQPSGPAGLSIEQVPAAGREYLSAEHELLYRQTLFDLLMKQYDAARLDEAKEASIIQVVAPAIPPDRKSSPMRGLLIAFFTIGGVLAGSIAALALWWREILQSDPVIVRQIRTFRSALTGREPAGA